MRPGSSPHPRAVRDRALRLARRTTRACAVGALGLTAGLSLIAAHAVRGHTRGEARGVVPRAATASATARARVLPPQPVPQIDGAPAALQPPAQAPAPDNPAPAPAPAPAVSGGS